MLSPPIRRHSAIFAERCLSISIIFSRRRRLYEPCSSFLRPPFAAFFIFTIISAFRRLFSLSPPPHADFDFLLRDFRQERRQPLTFSPPLCRYDYAGGCRFISFLRQPYAMPVASSQLMPPASAILRRRQLMFSLFSPLHFDAYATPDAIELAAARYFQC